MNGSLVIQSSLFTLEHALAGLDHRFLCDFFMMPLLLEADTIIVVAD